MKKYLKFIQIGLSLLLLLLVCWQAGLLSVEGRRAFWQLLEQANVWYLLLSVAVGVLINMCSAFKWYMLTRVKQLGASYWRIFAYYVIGQFYNMFLPTSVGGDVVRSYQLGKYSGRQAEALASVFVERYTGVLVLLIMAFFAILSKVALLSEGFVVLCLVAFSAVLGCIAWMVYDNRIYLHMKHYVLQRWSRSAWIFAKLDAVIDSIDVYKTQYAALVIALFNSFLFYLVAVVNVYISAKVFQLEIDFIDMLIATPIIMLIMNIPFSLGNLGLMEFAYSFIFELFGYSPALGLSVALLMRLKSFFDASIGAALSPIFVTKATE